MIQLLKISRAGRTLAVLLVLLGSFLPRLRAQSLVFDSAQPAGDNRGAESWLGALAYDAQGNVYVGGYFAGTISFGSQQFRANASQHNSFVAKYNADGDLLWARQVDPNSYQRILALAVDAAGNVYVGGNYTGPIQVGTQTLAPQTSTQGADIFVAKLDAAGTWQWAVGAGGSEYDGLNALAVSATGEVTVAGGFESPVANFGATQLRNANPGSQLLNQDIYVAQLSPAGTWLSAVRAGGSGNELAYDLALDATGAAYLCGTFTSSQAQFGAIALTNSGSNDAFVAKLGAAGSWEWATQLGGPGSLFGLALDASGRPYVTGSFSGPSLTLGATTLTNTGLSSADIVVAALTADGHWRWASSAGSTGADLGLDLGVAPSGQLTVVGQFYSRQLTLGASMLLNSTTNPGDGEAYVARLDASGNWLNALAPTGTGEKEARQVTVGADGTTYIAGTYWGTQAQFGAATLAGVWAFPTCFLAHVGDASQVPLLSTLSPSSAAAGQLVTVQGANFVDVRSVRFNGVPAAFQVQSTRQLTATVPAGATAGPLRVRTASGTGATLLPFATTPLASAAASAPGPLLLWPNPVGPAGTVHLQLPAGLVPTGPTQAELCNSLGQLVATTEFRGAATSWPLQLSVGLYQLTLRPAGQAALRQRLVVGE